MESAEQFGSVDDLLVVRMQWRSWISLFDTPSARWINPIWSARRAENKIDQMRAAAAVGFTVPATIITNDRAEATEFATRGEAVVKSLASAYFELSGQEFMYTQSLGAALDHGAVEWYAQPVIVQRRVAGCDVRVIVFAEQCFAAQCSSPGLDWRRHSGDVTWTEIAVPSRIRSACMSYLDIFGLRYAAFDFMVAGSEWQFLEANQAGEWSFIDRLLGLGIASTLASELARLASWDQ